MAKRYREFRICLPNGEMPCISFGKGKRNLLILPGLRTSSIEKTGWFISLYYRIFSKDFRVYILDRIIPVSDGCTIHDLAEDTFAAIEKLGISNSFVFAASQGGMNAMDLAVNHPDLTERMVLAVTSSRMNPTIEEAVGTWIRDTEKGDAAAVTKDYFIRGYSRSYVKKYGFLLPLISKLVKIREPERFIALAKACLNFDIYNDLEKIRCPVLVIGGEDDRVVSPEASEEIASKLNCECLMLEGLSHEAYNEFSGFNSLVYDFLKKE